MCVSVCVCVCVCVCVERERGRGSTLHHGGSLRGDKSPSRQPQENPLLTSSTPVGAVKGEVS